MSDEPNHPSPITGNRSPVPVIALDGPSGSGKGTVGQLLARRLEWHFLDSGALYRVLGLAATRAGLDPSRGIAKIADIAQTLDIRFVPQSGAPPEILLNGSVVGAAVRTEEAGRRASELAALPEVRRALLQKQHAFRRLPGLVADGRDMGSTVFPDAVLKIFLTATPEQRAERRYKQLKDKGFDVNLPRLLRDIRERDARDAARAVSPLEPAADACIVDTSLRSIEEVVDHVLQLLRERRRD